MKHPQRLLVRTALRIHERLIHEQAALPNLSLPEFAWAESRKAIGLLRLAGQRRWQAAIDGLRDQLAYSLRDLRGELERLEREVTRPRHEPQVQSPHEIYDDLVTLERDFEGLRIDLKGQLLSVETDSIMLEEVDFGRFQIELDWSDVGQARSYEVKALDPYPAQADSEVVHPHVRENSLCEGEGQGPIRRALEQGRLLDFFLLVRQILETYNPGSAYESIDKWESGLSCGDCGHRMSGDDSSGCGRCGRDLCDECVSSCGDCGDYYCPGCLSECNSCAELFCNGCLKSCEVCDKKLCGGCLTDDLCSECLEQREEEQDAEEPEADGAVVEAAPAAVHALCLGEVAVPA